VARIEKQEWWASCVEWGAATRKSTDAPLTQLLHAYLTAQEMIGPKDEGHVNDRTLDIGMTECGMFAARGKPQSTNNTRTTSGRQTQFVYSDRLYVYTEPSPLYRVGVIRAIQN
jgi:hypothetical protein